VGFIVPRYAHTAVARNRLKRRLRELTRTRLLPVLPPVDLVIRALPSAYAASFEALAHGIERAADVICGGC
jgi:ribonuclease P protein component